MRSELPFPNAASPEIPVTPQTASVYQSSVRSRIHDALAGHIIPETRIVFGFRISARCRGGPKRTLPSLVRKPQSVLRFCPFAIRSELLYSPLTDSEE